MEKPTHVVFGITRSNGRETNVAPENLKGLEIKKNVGTKPHIFQVMIGYESFQF